MTKRATTQSEIEPLLRLCREGKLFDVQAWIAAGKPVNGPPPPKKGRRPQSALECAIETGFHSLVEVLLDGGAEMEERLPSHSSLHHALESRQFSIAKLLVERGTDATKVDMNVVFDTYSPEMLDYFIQKGADVETGYPLASALCDRIRPALGILKRYQDRFRSFKEQANIALRHHCSEGNRKWVSLMLWAGADPYSAGVDDPESDPEEWGVVNAFECAAMDGHGWVFEFDRMHFDPAHSAVPGILQHATWSTHTGVLSKLLGLGCKPNDRPDGSSSLLDSVLSRIGFPFDGCSHAIGRLDTHSARTNLSMLRLLVEHGARWAPEDKRGVTDARQNLLRLAPNYTVEFVGLLVRHSACQEETLAALLRTPAMQRHLGEQAARLEDQVARMAKKPMAKRRRREPQQ